MKAKSRYGMVIFALFLLFIPAIKIIDVFPDFIAYFILAGVMSYGVDKLPYFEEARSAFIKLGIINLFRIPAVILTTSLRASNYGDTDIYAMMVLLFGVVEGIYLFPAISNLFEALFYLGSRSDATATLAEVECFGKRLTASSVKNLSYGFAGARALLALIPELCLMSATDKTGTMIITHPYAHLYPYLLLPCLLASLAFGIVWYVAVSRYVRAIAKEGAYYTAIDALVTDERRPEIESKTKLRRASSALNMMMIASLLTLDITFDNFGDVNILPHFIFAILLVSGLRYLTGKTKYTSVASAVATGYSAISLAAHGVLIAFLEEWNYTEIKLIDDAAKAYRPVVIFSALEFLLAAALIITVMLALRDFTVNNTKVPPTAENYGAPDRDFHKSLFKKNVIYSLFGILATASKLVLVLLNSGSDYIHVGSADGGISAIATTAVPWFGLLITVLALLYAGSAFYFLGILKDELKMKYQ